METAKLKSLTVKELSALAAKLGIQDYVGVKKQDLIKLILFVKVLRLENRCIKTIEALDLNIDDC